MSLQHLTLGERIVMSARLLAAEHLRQEADAAGIDVRLLQREMELVRINAAKAAFARGEETPPADDTFRQDLFRQPKPAKRRSKRGDDDRRAA